MTYPAVSPKLPIQAIGAKIFHYCNFISLLIMLTSGLQIYNANPVFGGRGGLRIFPLFTLGGWLAGGRHWHFAAMVQNGAPLRLASPVKLGYKQSKWVTGITLTSELSTTQGYWEDRGYEWFAGL
jgi:hypothetical protein